LVIASIVDRESFYKQHMQLDSTTRFFLSTRLDYYQVKIDLVRQYRAHSSLVLDNNNHNIKVSKTTENGSWHGLIWDGCIHKYTIAIFSSPSLDIMVGFAPFKLFDITKGNSNSCGWYCRLQNGCLYSQNGVISGKAYTSNYAVGETITCIYNASKGEISFEKNGVSLGLAFSNVSGEDIAPAVELGNIGDTITLFTKEDS
jgi:SPRY domain